MNRRDFLRSTAVTSAGLALWKSRALFAKEVPSKDWRTFEVTTRLEVLKFGGQTRVWVPAALIGGAPFQRTLSNTFVAEGGTVKMTSSKPDALGIIAAEFPSGIRPVGTITSRIATRDFDVDLSATHGTARSDVE